MRLLSRLTVIMLAATAAVFSSPLRATGPSYEGMWWNPNESGWGVNLTHQGPIIFATWFIFGTDGKPYWVVSALSQAGASATFTGNVYGGSGTPYTISPFDPNATNGTIVGIATATFQGVNQLTLWVAAAV